MMNNTETTQSHYETQQQAEMREALAKASEQEAAADKTIDIQRAMAIIAVRPVSKDSVWQDSALCSVSEVVDPEIFDENTQNFEQVKKLCGACTVQEQCLEYALSRDEQFLLWGGITKDQLRALKRRRSRARQRDF